MPGCSAVDCANSTANGFKLYRFPKQPSRRKEWAIKVKRDQWVPNDHTKLCEVHFEEDQFNTKADGSKKLKPTAVPTIFNHRPRGTKRKAPRWKNEEPEQPLQKVSDHAYFRSPSPSTSQQSHQPYHVEEPTETSDEDDFKENRSPNSNVSSEPALRSTSTSIQPPVICVENFEVTGTCSSFCHKDREERDHLREVNQALIEENKRMQKEVRRTNMEKARLVKRLKKCQVKNKAGRKGNRWTNLQVKKALQLKFACGTTGYKLLLDQDYELPSISTLYKRSASFQFLPGIITEVFELLAIKAKQMQEEDRRCVLTLDEMSLKVGYNFDIKSGSCFGEVTLPGHSGDATKALAFMLGGISLHWKQTVAYYFTPNSVDGIVFGPIIKEIIAKAKEAGLDVRAVVNDMGSSNQKMWH